MFFILRDFFASKQGKLLLYSFAVGLAIVFAIQLHTKKESPTKQMPSSKPDIWAESNEQANTPLQESRRKPSFVPFSPITPPADLTEVAELETQEEPATPPIKSNPTRYHSPLIKEERAPRLKVKTEPQQQRRQSPTPTLEPGAVIHCQLLTPATTESNNSTVIGRVTRSLVRDGITLIPRGSRIMGQVRNSQNNRIFFSTAWQVITIENTQLSLTAHVQEKGFDLFTEQFTPQDGTLGLPGFIENDNTSRKAEGALFGNVLKGIGKLGKETVRTNAGEFIPSTGRNIIIDGSSTIIDGILKDEDESKTMKPYVYVPAGQEFYLVVSTSIPASSEKTEEQTIDELLNQAVKRRLQK